MKTEKYGISIFLHLFPSLLAPESLHPFPISASFYTYWMSQKSRTGPKTLKFYISKCCIKEILWYPHCFTRLARDFSFLSLILFNFLAVSPRELLFVFLKSYGALIPPCRTFEFSLTLQETWCSPSTATKITTLSIDALEDYGAGVGFLVHPVCISLTVKFKQLGDGWW